MMLLRTLILLAFFTLPAYAAKPDAKFHPPQTEAERALDRILQRYDKDDDLDLFIFNRLQKNHAKGKEFSRLFTPGFLKSAEAQRKMLVKKSCGGKYPENDLECDMLEGVQPIYCASDHPDVFLFRTVLSSQDHVIISYSAVAEPYENKADMHLYKMIQASDGWKLDGIDCGENQTLNMD